MKHGNSQFSSCPYPILNSRKGMGGGKGKKIWLGRSIPLWILAGAQIELSVGIQHGLLNSRLLWPYEGQHPADSKQCLGHAKLWDCHEELNGFLHHCRENSCDSAVLPQFPLKRPLKQIHRSAVSEQALQASRDHCYCLQRAWVRMGSLAQRCRCPRKETQINNVTAKSNVIWFGKEHRDYLWEKQNSLLGNSSFEKKDLTVTADSCI